MESSSHKYGLFQHICREFEVRRPCCCWVVVGGGEGALGWSWASSATHFHHHRHQLAILTCLLRDERLASALPSVNSPACMPVEYSLQVALADGSVVTCSPTDNPELFYNLPWYDSVPYRPEVSRHHVISHILIQSASNHMYHRQ